MIHKDIMDIVDTMDIMDIMNNDTISDYGDYGGFTPRKRKIGGSLTGPITSIIRKNGWIWMDLELLNAS